MASSLLRFLFRRLLFALALVFLVSSFSLVLARLAPGDYTSQLLAAGVSPEVVARERSLLGLDRRLTDQYLDWVGRAVRFDLGYSLRYRRPVRDLLADRAVNTALLGAVALLVATLVGIPLGVVTGSRAGPVVGFVRTVSVASLSVPPLVTALLLATFAARTGWFPIGGMPGVSSAAGWLDGARLVAWSLALPATALALPFAAVLERVQSQAMAEALREPHVVAALARGIPHARIIWRDTLRVAIKPVAAIYGILIGSLFSGSFVVEYVTAWPGLGRLMYDGLVYRDIYLVAGCAAAGSVFLACGSFVSDLVVAAVDPRVRRVS